MLQALFEQTINGLMMGSIYVTVALGLVLIYGVMHVLNFSHGVLFMFGGYTAHLFFTQVIGNYALAIVFAMAVLVLVGAAMEHVVFRPLRHNLQNQVVAALGLILIIQNLVLFLWGPHALLMKVQTTAVTISMGYLRFSLQHILIIVVTLAGVALLYAFLRWTKIGTAMRATSQNQEAALVVGVNVNRMFRMSFAMGTAIAALGGALIGPLFLIFPAMGDLPLMKALAAILLGGMGSVWGAVAGGLLIGVIEAVATLFIATDYRDVITFLIIIGILLLRPQGIFGLSVRTSS
jgi:branched-chain amino acid transport system permease protein